jgi:hypothetical protein
MLPGRWVESVQVIVNTRHLSFTSSYLHIVVPDPNVTTPLNMVSQKLKPVDRGHVNIDMRPADPENGKKKERVARSMSWEAAEED